MANMHNGTIFEREYTPQEVAGILLRHAREDLKLPKKGKFNTVVNYQTTPPTVPVTQFVGVTVTMRRAG